MPNGAGSWPAVCPFWGQFHRPERDNLTVRLRTLQPSGVSLAGYEVSQRFRKRVEEVFGWMKTVGLMRKTRHRGTDRVGWVFTFTAAAYNLVRIRNLLEAT